MLTLLAVASVFAAFIAGLSIGLSKMDEFAQEAVTIEALETDLVALERVLREELRVPALDAAQLRYRIAELLDAELDDVYTEFMTAGYDVQDENEYAKLRSERWAQFADRIIALCNGETLEPNPLGAQSNG